MAEAMRSASRRSCMARMRTAATRRCSARHLPLLLVLVQLASSGAAVLFPAAAPRCGGLWMGSGDGKRRRGKKQGEQPAAADGTDAARRVNSADSLLSVRKQIALVKAYRAVNARPAPSVKRTSFRRSRTAARDATDEENDAGDGGVDSARSRGAEAWMLPLLFVDGYNIIGKWARLKKRKEKDDLAGARRLLLDDLLQFAPRRFEVVCVFDAYGQKERVDRVDEYHGITVVFTASTADEYIETETLRLSQEKAPQRVWAATSDRAVQVSASMHGATVVSANWLVRELKDSRAESDWVVAEFNKQQGARSTLLDSLKPGQREEFESRFSADPTAALPRRDREAALRLQGEQAAANARLRAPGKVPRRKQNPPRTTRGSPSPVTPGAAGGTADDGQSPDSP